MRRLLKFESFVHNIYIFHCFSFLKLEWFQVQSVREEKDGLQRHECTRSEKVFAEHHEHGVRGIISKRIFKNLASGNSGNRLCSWKVDLDFEKDQTNDADKFIIHDRPWTTSTRRRRLSSAIFLFSIYHSSDCDKYGLAAYARHFLNPFWSRCVKIALLNEMLIFWLWPWR